MIFIYVLFCMHVTSRVLSGPISNVAAVITGVRLGHMKNALVGVLTIQSIQHPRVHSSHDLVSYEE